MTERNNEPTIQERLRERAICNDDGRLSMQAADELDRLQAIVDTHPKTADGIIIMPGLEVFFAEYDDEMNRTGVYGYETIRFETMDRDKDDWRDVYSTLEAAKEANA